MKTSFEYVKFKSWLRLALCLSLTTGLLITAACAENRPAHDGQKELAILPGATDGEPGTAILLRSPMQAQQGPVIAPPAPDSAAASPAQPAPIPEVKPKVPEVEPASPASLAPEIGKVGLGLLDGETYVRSWARLEVDMQIRGELVQWKLTLERKDEGALHSGQSLSTDQRYHLQMSCKDNDCLQTELKVVDRQTRQQAIVLVTRRTDVVRFTEEAQKREGQLQPRNEQEALLFEAARYKWSVERSQIEVQGVDRTFTQLELIPPVADQEEGEAAPVPDHGLRRHRWVVEAQPVVQLEARTPGPIQRPEQNAQVEVGPMEVPEFEELRDNESFQPAHRIILVARRWIETKRKVPLNACNIFVREVMREAGFTQGTIYKANDFHLTFKASTHGLSQWEKYSFKHGQRGDKEALQQLLDRIPAEHAVIFQVRRSGRSGHVAMITREDDKIVQYDSSISSRGGAGRPPRRRELGVDQLLSRSRANVTVFAMPGMLNGAGRGALIAHSAE